MLSFQVLQINQECFPMFHNLIHLELELGNCIKWPSLFEMLKHCPRLQTLALNKSPPEIWPCPKFVPECVASQLRRCSIVFHKDSELQFANYIMQNSRALQTITIDNTCSLNFWNNAQVPPEVDELSSFCPKGSATFKLLYKFSIGRFCRLVQFVPEWLHFQLVSSYDATTNGFGGFGALTVLLWTYYIY